MARKPKLMSTRQLRLSPRDIGAHNWLGIAGLAKLLLSKDEEAVVRLRRAVETNRNWPSAHFYLAAALAQLGRSDEAKAAARAGLALAPASPFTATVPVHRATIRPIWRSASAFMKACARQEYRRDERPQAASSSSKALASFRSGVSKPSVNQL